MCAIPYLNICREVVLVTAAAGGVGLAAVDLATNMFGAKVRIKYPVDILSQEFCTHFIPQYFCAFKSILRPGN